MTGLPPDYLRYRARGYGMDHDRYDWSILPRRPRIEWPGGARIALWVIPALEWFPIDMKGRPFKPPGAMQTAYPDLRHYTLRDYGNRVGIWRMMRSFDRLGIRVSAAMNAAVATRYPALLDACVSRGWEIIANGQDMDHLHYEGLPVEDERKQIATTLETFRRVPGLKVRGWLSPAKSQSNSTPDLLAAAGIEYCCDWVNDDMPYAMRAGGRDIVSMPLCADIEDAGLLIAWHQDEDDLRQQWIDQFDYLYAESQRHGPRIMALPLHAWTIGQPYRIGVLADVLDHMLAKPGVWAATGGQIMEAWLACQAKA